MYKNWNQWQEIKIQAADDDLFTPGHAASIRHFSAKGKTPVFNAYLSKEVAVRVVENDKDVIETLEPIDPEKRMEWFRDMKYYWFIHWNPSSLAGTEISWSREAVGKEKYDNLYKDFNPTEFDAEEWVKIAKAAGFKTIVFTSKHHDGFCMWDTKTEHLGGPKHYSVMDTIVVLELDGPAMAIKPIVTK